jgi:hypothetical protein
MSGAVAVADFSDRALLPLHDRDLTPAQRRELRSETFARYVSALRATDGAYTAAAELVIERFPRSFSAEVMKAAIDAGNIAPPGNWAAPLSPIKPLADAFVSLAREASVLGRIPALRRVPFQTSVPVEMSGATYAWVGAGLSKPVSKFTFASATLAIAKASGIIVVTDELLKATSAGSALALRDALVAGLAQFLDQQFLDPAIAPVADVSPGSITNGITPIAGTGDVAADLATLIDAFLAANPSLESAVLIVSPATALRLAQAIGNLADWPLTIVPSVQAGTSLILIDAAQVLVADEGGIALDVSREATLQLDSAPATPPTNVVSLWQQNLVGLRAERFITWKRARAEAVAFVTES